MGDVTCEVALHLGAQHPEGPTWDAATRRLWWVDIPAERVHCFDPVSGGDDAWAVGAQPGGVVLDEAGEPVVAMPEGLARLDRGNGALTPLVAIEADRPENRANDAKVDGRGRLWVGSMAYDKRPASAALHRVDRGEVTRMVGGLTISNGPAFDEAAGRLYLADSALGIVDLFDLDVATGAIRGRRRFLDVHAEGWWPDGMIVDDDGMLWVALGRAGAVHRYTRAGVLDGVVEVPTSNPTSVAFGGADGRDLYITTSWTDLDPEEREREPLAGAILRARPGVSAPPSPRYRRS